jgi:electron transfer flavoprotein alpha subunit
MGRDLAAFLSVDYDCPVVANAIDIQSFEPFILTTAINGGKELYSTEIKAKIKIVVVRPKSFDYVETKVASIDKDNILIINESDLDIKIDKVNIEPKSGPQLEDSSIIVSAGRGLGEAENLSIVYELAEKLNAAVGATRAIVDAGWIPYSQQVGQTGKTVKPDVYIACGISGATQHLVGMKDSKYIIAINKDEDAPIFQIADFGIIGDVHQVIPKLNSLI